MTAVCGHGFHPSCADTLMVGRRRLECPECDGEDVAIAAGDDGKLWRTFWMDGDADVGSAAAEPDTDDQPPPAPWRSVVRLERRVDELRSSLARSRQELERERAKAKRAAETESALRREITLARSELSDCRERSLRTVVAHGASRWATTLVIPAMGPPLALMGPPGPRWEPQSARTPQGRRLSLPALDGTSLC